MISITPNSSAYAPQDAKHHALDQLLQTLQVGKVYRREDFAMVSKAVDRHLQQLVSQGALKRIAQGLYHAPQKSVFGDVPPDDHELVTAFLKDSDFLVFSPSHYNSLGLGLTQLYNKTVVYNHKRHGTFVFGHRQFDFRVKHRFPQTLSPEFLLVDVINNLHELAENQHSLIERTRQKLTSFDTVKLTDAISKYGSVATQKRFRAWLNA
jgi:hypothetical protein